MRGPRHDVTGGWRLRATLIFILLMGTPALASAQGERLPPINGSLATAHVTPDHRVRDGSAARALTTGRAATARMRGSPTDGRPAWSAAAGRGPAVHAISTVSGMPRPLAHAGTVATLTATLRRVQLGFLGRRVVARPAYRHGIGIGVFYSF